MDPVGQHVGKAGMIGEIKGSSVNVGQTVQPKTGMIVRKRVIGSAWFFFKVLLLAKHS